MSIPNNSITVYYNPELGDIKAQIAWLIANGDAKYQQRSRSYICALALAEWLEDKAKAVKNIEIKKYVDSAPREEALQFVHSPKTYNIKARIGDLKKLNRDLNARSESTICLIAIREWLSNKGIPANLPPLSDDAE